MCTNNIYFRSCSAKYSQRTDSQTVQFNYGPPGDFKMGPQQTLTVSALGNSLKADVKYMFEIMGKKALSLNIITKTLGHAILTAHGLMLSEGPLKLNLVSCSDI